MQLPRRTETIFFTCGARKQYRVEKLQRGARYSMLRLPDQRAVMQQLCFEHGQLGGLTGRCIDLIS
jgi:hypothetical protein